MQYSTGRPRTYPEGVTLVRADGTTKREISEEAQTNGISQTEQVRRVWRLYKHLKATSPAIVQNFFCEDLSDR